MRGLDRYIYDEMTARDVESDRLDAEAECRWLAIGDVECPCGRCGPVLALPAVLQADGECPF